MFTEYRIDEIATLKYGKMPKKEILTESGYPVYSGYRITGYASEYLYKEPMVIVVARGVGGTGDVKISPANAWITNLSIVLDIDKTKVDRYYLTSLLGQEALKDKLNTGSAQSQITINSLDPYKVKLPSLVIQQKIASILSTYDVLIENNNRRISILEEMAQRLYREWFVKFRFPGHENVKMVDLELGEIPEGWEVVKLSDIAKVNPESITARTAPESIKYVDISSVGTGKIDNIKEMLFSEAPSRARRKVANQDIIWATVRPNRKQFAYIVHPDEDTIVSTGFAVIRAEKVPSSYLYFTVTADKYVSYLVNNATGSAYPAVNVNEFKNSDILKPSHELLEKYTKHVDSLLTLIKNMSKKNKNLKQQRDLLLPKLISGKIDV